MTAPIPGSPPRLLLVAMFGAGHVGAHLLRAAQRAGLSVQACDMEDAYGGPRLLRSASWRFRGRRPPRLAPFSRHVLAVARDFQPDVVLTSGLCPVDAGTVRALRHLGARLLNFSTDDPWSPAGRSAWFLEAVREYDAVFTPRHANIADLEALRGPAAYYMPFAFSEDLHRPVILDTEEIASYGCDVTFVGSADADRATMFGPVASTRLDVRLYGRYWDRFPATVHCARGPITGDLATVATLAGRVAPCLVRRSNRDGHSMRTFELAAMGACIAAEDTDDHRRLFGEDGVAVRYFDDAGSLRDVSLELLAAPALRRSMSKAALELMTPEHSYSARLAQMLAAVR